MCFLACIVLWLSRTCIFVNMIESLTQAAPEANTPFADAKCPIYDLLLGRLVRPPLGCMRLGRKVRPPYGLNTSRPHDASPCRQPSRPDARKNIMSDQYSDVVKIYTRELIFTRSWALERRT